MKQSFKEMETEIEQLEEEKKGLESISARAVELESEVAKIQEDFERRRREGVRGGGAEERFNGGK